MKFRDLFPIPCAALIMLGAVAASAQDSSPREGSSATVSLNEEEIFREAGFSEQAIALLAWCPIHRPFAERVALLQKIQRPLSPDKVRQFNQSVSSCAGQLVPGFGLDPGICAKMQCEELIEVFELPVRRVMSPRAVRAEEQQREHKQKQKEDNFQTIAAMVTLLFTLVAVGLERMMRGGKSSR